VFFGFLVFPRVLHRVRPARADPEGPMRSGGARADSGGRCGGVAHTIASLLPGCQHRLAKGNDLAVPRLGLAREPYAQLQ